MTDARWTRIEELFDRAADLPPDEQRTLVARESGDDVDLCNRVLALLAHDRERGARLASALEAAAHLPSLDDDAPAFTATRCGPYRIVREIGRGGMGVVFEAERDDGAFTKRVALKVAARAAYSREFLQRFREERQILARLEHPHIARLLDGGATDDGIPYFAMELVAGEPIHEYVKSHQLGLVPRLRLFLQVCDAVDYAHQNLVIHRDLTPRNILVADDSVRLLDFGISKLIDTAAGGGMTTGGLTPFTPAYCSPEQLRGEPVTTRTDVYTLGLVLFEILTGARAQPVDGTSPAAMERAICETPIPAPSVCTRDDRAWARRLRGDLDTIVLTATEREPSRRYASVAALAADIRRYLESRPVEARRASAWYRTTRFTRRHWRPLSAAALLLAALAAGIVSTRAQAERAERRFQEVRRIANTLMTDVHAAIRDLPASAKAQAVVVATAVQYLEGLAREAGSDRALLTEVGQGYLKVAQLAFSRSRPSLERPDDARQYLERARAIVAPLHVSHPEDVEVATAMVQLQTAEGRFLDDTARSTEALRAMEEAIRTGEAALARDAADADLLAVLLDAYGHLIASFMTSPAAVQHAPRYLELAEQHTQRSSPAVDSRSALANAYSQVGKIVSATGSIDEALVYFRRTADLNAEIVAAEPFNATARRNLMLTWSNIADMALGPLGLNSYNAPGGPLVDLDEDHRRQAFEAAAKAVEQAEWIHQRDPNDVSATLDYAIALGRSGPTYAPGDPEAITVLEQSLAILQGLEAKDADRTRAFLIEFYANLAERHRQTGRIDRALEAWRDTDAAFRRFIASTPDAFYPRRQLIPVLENWAMTLTRHGRPAEARRVAERAVTAADEVASLGTRYLRAPGWPPRVRDWLADFYESLGDHAAAGRARVQSRTQWTAVAGRTDLPADLTDEAKAALARPPVQR